MAHHETSRMPPPYRLRGATNKMKWTTVEIPRTLSAPRLSDYVSEREIENCGMPTAAHLRGVRTDREAALRHPLLAVARRRWLDAVLAWRQECAREHRFPTDAALSHDMATGRVWPGKELQDQEVTAS